MELMLATAVIGLLTALAIPAYSRVTENLKVDRARQDLLVIANLVQRWRTAHDFKLPESLGDLTGVPPKDPWGNPYRYLSFSSNAPGINGKIRKDHNLHPLNTEFDLYSMGPDGDSKSPLTASASRDDIIWARDGSFVGKAKDF